MPTNTNTESCIRNERGALVFTAPGSGRLRDGSRVQILTGLAAGDTVMADARRQLPAGAKVRGIATK